MPAANINAKGRRKTAPFVGIPKAVLATRKYAQLSGWDVKLLLDLVSQYNGRNNGDLCAVWTDSDTFTGMRSRGWRSKGTLYRSIHNLIAAGFIQVTRKGGEHKPTLYGITWEPVDEIIHPRTKTSKLDAGFISGRALKVAAGLWKDDA